MKNENIDNFSHYEHASAGPRIQCRMTPYGPHSSYISPGGSVPEGYYSRGNSMSSYVVPQSRYYALGSFSEYPEENVNVDYGVQASTYPMLASDQLIPPNYPPPNRGWTPAPQMTKTTPMYLEQDPTYNNTQVPYHNAYQLRPTISPEPKSLVHPVRCQLASTTTLFPRYRPVEQIAYYPFPQHAPHCPHKLALTCVQTQFLTQATTTTASCLPTVLVAQNLFPTMVCQAPPHFLLMHTCHTQVVAPNP
jgi:hypothetical protein